LYSLKIDDKLDIFDGGRDGDKCWHIGTIINIEHNRGKCTTLLIHFDGWESKWDEWVKIDHSKRTCTKLKKIAYNHTISSLFKQFIINTMSLGLWYDMGKMWYMQQKMLYQMFHDDDK